MSGCIAISLAKRLLNADVWGVDISEEVLGTARSNALRNNVNVSFVQADALTCTLPITRMWDVIVSNPPYIKEDEKLTMSQNVLAYEPHLALFVPNEDPLLFYRAITRIAKTTLKPDGGLYFEINEAHAEDMLSMLRLEGFIHAEVICDFYGKDRIIQARR